MQYQLCLIFRKEVVFQRQEQPLILTNRSKPLSFQDRLTALQEQGSVLMGLLVQNTLTYKPL